MGTVFGIVPNVNIGLKVVVKKILQMKKRII